MIKNSYTSINLKTLEQAQKKWTCKGVIYFCLTLKKKKNLKIMLGNLLLTLFKKFNEDQRGSRIYSWDEHLFVKKRKLGYRTWIVLFEKS